jgi:hypothetical protein
MFLCGCDGPGERCSKHGDPKMVEEISQQEVDEIIASGDPCRYFIDKPVVLSEENEALRRLVLRLANRCVSQTECLSRCAEKGTGQAGDPRFHTLLEEIASLHSRKQADYGRGDDPFANIRGSADFAIPPWVGAVVRGNDKMHRIKSFLQNGNLKNESVEDSLLDLAVYAIIALILYREERGIVQGEAV